MLKKENGQAVEDKGLNLSAGKDDRLSINKENIITFEDGIFGFDNLKQYVLLHVEECHPFEWLVSVENPRVSFAILNPVPYFSDYNPMESMDEMTSLGFSDAKSVETFCIVTLGKSATDTTVNLKGPLLIDMKKKMGKQIVKTEDYYSLHHPLIRK